MRNDKREKDNVKRGDRSGRYNRPIAFLLLFSLLSGLLLLGGCDLLEEEADAYRVLVMNEAGDPLEGASVQFCTDTICMLQKTDAEGLARFQVAPGVYTVHVLEAPEGYFSDPKQEYITEDVYSTLEIMLFAGESEALAVETSDETAEEKNQARTELSDETAELPEVLAQYRMETYQPVSESRFGALRFSGAQDIAGNPVDDSIFSQNRVTVVNVFASWCGPCMSELPEFSEVSKDLEGTGVGFVGIVNLTNDSAASLQSVIDEFDLTYPVIQAFPELNPYMTGYIPLTFFVDSGGNLLDVTQEEMDAIVRSLMEPYADQYGADWETQAAEIAKEQYGQAPGRIQMPISRDALLMLIADRYAQ